MDQGKIGAFLKQLRTEKGLTQERLAEQFNVSNRSVSRWETGSNMPDLSILVELASYYGVGIDEILNGERKSEKMENEEKKTADLMATAGVMATANLMAEYAEKEKASLLKKVRTISIYGLIAFLWMVVMLFSAPNPMNPLYGCIFGMVGGGAYGALLVMVLYTTGLLEKMRAKCKGQNRKKVKIFVGICVTISVALIVAAAIRTFLG